MYIQNDNQLLCMTTRLKKRVKFVFEIRGHFPCWNFKIHAVKLGSHIHIFRKFKTYSHTANTWTLCISSIFNHLWKIIITMQE